MFLIRKTIIAPTLALGVALGITLAGRHPLPALAAPATAAPTTLATSASPAGGAPLVRLTKAQAGRFPDALDALARQGHVALIAEGMPRKPQLADKDVPNLTTGTPLPQAIIKLAVAYDYDAQRQDSGAWVLTKRYTDPRDLPCVTLGECIQAARDVDMVLDTFNPHLPQGARAQGPQPLHDTIVAFLQTLTPDQEQAMQNKALRYGDLSPEQQAPLQQLLLYQFVQEQMPPLDQAATEMEQAATARLTARDEAGDSIVCLELPIPEGISDPHSRDGKHMLKPVVGGFALPPAGQAPPPVLLPPAPTPAGSPPPKPQTLGQVVAALAPIDGQKSVVDKALAAKPVTAAGLETLTPMDTLRALAAVYGLRIGASDKQEAPELERQPAPTPDDLRQISDDVWAAVPAPFLRALHAQAPAPAPPVPPKDSSQAEALRWFQEDQRQDQARWHIRDLPAGWEAEGMRRLLVALQPGLRAGGVDARVPVASLDDASRSALAVVLMSRLIENMNTHYANRNTQALFDCLYDNMDQTLISGRPEENPFQKGKIEHSLFMIGTDPTTGDKIMLGGAGWNFSSADF